MTIHADISLLPFSMPPLSKVLLWWIQPIYYQYLIVLCWCCREKDVEGTVPVQFVLILWPVSQPALYFSSVFHAWVNWECPLFQQNAWWSLFWASQAGVFSVCWHSEVQQDFTGMKHHGMALQAPVLTVLWGVSSKWTLVWECTLMHPDTACPVQNLHKCIYLDDAASCHEIIPILSQGRKMIEEKVSKWQSKY